MRSTTSSLPKKCTHSGTRGSMSRPQTSTCPLCRAAASPCVLRGNRSRRGRCCRESRWGAKRSPRCTLYTQRHPRRPWGWQIRPRTHSSPSRRGSFSVHTEQPRPRRCSAACCRRRSCSQRGQSTHRRRGGSARECTRRWQRRCSPTRPSSCRAANPAHTHNHSQSRQRCSLQLQRRRWCRHTPA